MQSVLNSINPDEKHIIVVQEIIRKKCRTNDSFESFMIDIFFSVLCPDFVTGLMSSPVSCPLNSLCSMGGKVHDLSRFQYLSLSIRQ